MDNFPNRYIRNKITITPEENDFLAKCKVCVVGCGGLGGYIIELLVRLGVGHITAVDGDVFDETNLNRQLLSDETVIGIEKALVAKERMHKVNSKIQVTSVVEFLNEENSDNIIKNHNVVIDALDNVSSRLILAQSCKRNDLTLIHGAIGGWYGQVSVVPPGSKILDEIYFEDDEKRLEIQLGNPSFTPSLVASIQVSETIKFLLKKGDGLKNKILAINLLNCEFEIIDFT